MRDSRSVFFSSISVFTPNKSFVFYHFSDEKSVSAVRVGVERESATGSADRSVFKARERELAMRSEKSLHVALVLLGEDRAGGIDKSAARFYVA